MKQIVKIIALSAISAGLTGCVGHPSATTERHYTPPAQSKSQLLAQIKTPHANSESHSSLSAANHHAPTFSKVVSRLQNLGYLPITRAFIHTRVADHFESVRHDAFRWHVPGPLQQAVDHYPWNASNPFIRSAIIQFERQNGILNARGVSEGHLHTQVIHALFSSIAVYNKAPFKWVYVTKGSGTKQPEQLHVWEHGRAFAPASFGSIAKGFAIRNSWVWATVVNTGVLGTTPDGTFPIYQRLPTTTMQGVFPIPVSWGTYRAIHGRQVAQWSGSPLTQPARGLVNGHPVRWQPYRDPGIRWVNYFDAGRGIHYYPRTAYGFPQSAGCVEEPYSSAPITYKLLNYGDPVTISSSAFHGHPHVLS